MFRKSFFSKICFTVAVLNLAASLVSAQTLQQITDFGSNPGNLRMYIYSPANMPADSATPLVVVLHGCLQNAKNVAKQTGWNLLADRYGFRVLYPQQKIPNNPQMCFCWYSKNDIEKDKGEAYSIHQMIHKAKNFFPTDSTKVFITGLSAGAAMSVVLMADYPKTFNAGAIFAGGPYKAATNIWTGMMAMYGWRLKKPETWGNYIREQNSTYQGDYPRIIVYHGNMDVVVNRRNATELVKQWTNLHGISSTPSAIIPRFAKNKNIEKRVHRDSKGRELVTYYKIKGMGHALPVNPGKCETMGGRMGLFSADKNFFSSYWAAVDFGLISMPEISGPINVRKGQKGLTFSVPPKQNAAFQWNVPKGCHILSGQGTNSIIVDWGEEGGNVDVSEILSKKCYKTYRTLQINIIE